MNRTDKTAADLIADLRRLQTQYDACKCVGCGHKLHVYDMMGRQYAECKNKQCRRVDVTLTLAELQSLSNEQLDAKGYPDYSVAKAS